MSAPTRTTRCVSLLLGALLVLTLTAEDANAQFGKLKDKIKQRVNQTADQVTDKAIDQVDPTKQSPGEPPANAPAAAPAAAATAGAATPAAGAGAAAPTSKEWANYDFVPGSRVIYDIDFSEDRVGNFPQRLEFESGQLEIVELDGVRMLKASDMSTFLVPLKEPLPARYTIEIDFLSRNQGWKALEFTGGRERTPGDATRVDVGDQGVEVYTGGKTVLNSWYSDADRQALPGTLVHLRVQGDGDYLKMYVNEKRIVNVPNAKIRRENAILVGVAGADGGNKPVYVSRIRVAESQASIYDALSSTGRWTTQGILFETGKSDLKPESTPTLKEIAAALKGHADLSVEIQGHTDNVGQPATNLKLSDARAAAVKAALVGQYGVSEAQLSTRGYGDTKPVGDNKTAEGRQNNRRVELVKK